MKITLSQDGKYTSSVNAYVYQWEDSYHEAKESFFYMLYKITGIISLDYDKYFKNKIKYKIERGVDGRYRARLEETIKT